MSAGQRPRTPTFFPCMKHRARKRNTGKTQVTIYGADFKPVWPQVFQIGGKSYPVDDVSFTVSSDYGTRKLDRVTGRWAEVVIVTPMAVWP